MFLTIDQYVLNPLGRGATAGSLKIVKGEYDNKYQNLLNNFEEFQVNIYKIRKDSYYFHILIPSETTEDLFYDVVIRIDRGYKSTESSFLNWPMKAISNSPSFVFTYANTFKRNRSLIEELKSIIPTQAVNEFADVRNPNKLLGFEKTIFYACRYIKDNFKSIDQIDKESKPVNMRALLKELKDFKYIMKIKEADQKRKSEEKKKEREEQKKELNQKIRGREQNIGAVKKDQVPKKAPISVKSKKAITAKKAKRI
jgi:hypothetical protein